MKLLALTLVLLALPSFGQDTMKDCPMHATQSHQAVVESHGDQAMGFPKIKTTHHFRMMKNGGAIEITVNDPSDKVHVRAVRSHLSNIAIMFTEGDFSIPEFVHDGLPPGVTTMKLMKAAIHYKYEETPNGGNVKIKSDDLIVLAAIHDFLRFQITEHKTGDSLAVAKH
jgi:hypothetical protein